LEARLSRLLKDGRELDKPIGRVYVRDLLAVE
jgi:hypothetical protein